MSKYYLENNRFVIEGYDRQKPFASFLPGVAGREGIPMWVYYTNRGQGIAGFGIENKDGSILDFVPANQAYKRTESAGFRTFIKSKGQVYEIFASNQQAGLTRQMLIEPNGLGFVELNESLGLKIEVKYFTVTEESFPGLVRKVTFESLTQDALDIEVLDGLNTLWPYGNGNGAIKDMSNLAVAWFEVYNEDTYLPFFRNRSTTADSAEVGTVEAGHFVASFGDFADGPLPIIYDPEVIFENNTAASLAEALYHKDLATLLEERQISANKIPCAYAGFEVKGRKTATIYSVFGKMDHVDDLNEKAKTWDKTFFEAQEALASSLGELLTEDVAGTTNYPVFDAYVRQSYMDNLLRGGYPLVFKGKEGPIVYHIYSRIHGDMEREYNNFFVEAAYYSQGVGAFRDVNQNRRNDVYFVGEAGKFNVVQFMELIQLDGQNPLSIQGSKLRVDKDSVQRILSLALKGKEALERLLESPFTPGELMTVLDRHKVALSVDRQAFLEAVMAESVQEIQAAYGHGFWVDHWTYNMDLLDNYLNVYPDGLDDLLYQTDYRYFVSPATVLPRDQKYVLNKEGAVRQYDAIMVDEKRKSQLGLSGSTDWLKDQEGKTVKTNLYGKLLSLVVNKMASLDPSGIGVMMNTDKPGWNDAMNGLPGLFGSGTSETIELKRIVDFLLDQGSLRGPILVPAELDTFIRTYYGQLQTYLGGQQDALGLYEGAQTLKENFNESIHFGIKGQGVNLDEALVLGFLEAAKVKLQESLELAEKMGQGIMPSYLVHEATQYEELGTTHPVNGLKNVRVSAWQVRALPLYLEAPARYLKQVHDPAKAKALYERILKSGMYDEALGMYITSESLEEETLEIGRARAFTAGWLERESVFMHMEYKYLLGLLKSGVYDGFFKTIKTALPPFMDPAVYGRSPLENSSFIASSRNPNPHNHGRGFVSRLTGTTSEMISMWLLMMTGLKMFKMKDATLTFGLKPILPGDFFDEAGQVSFSLFGHMKVIYVNPSRKDTFGEAGVKVTAYTLQYEDGQEEKLTQVVGNQALAIREGKVKTLLVTLA